MAPDLIGQWLPVALADIADTIAAAHGARPPKRSQTYAEWGLRALARRAERAEEEAAEALTERTLEGIA